MNDEQRNQEAAEKVSRLRLKVWVSPRVQFRHSINRLINFAAKQSGKAFLALPSIPNQLQANNPIIQLIIVRSCSTFHDLNRYPPMNDITARHMIC